MKWFFFAEKLQKFCIPNTYAGEIMICKETKLSPKTFYLGTANKKFVQWLKELAKIEF